MKVIQKLVRNGSSIQLTIPRYVLATLEWLPSILVYVDVAPEIGPNCPCPVCDRPLPETFAPQGPSLRVTRATDEQGTLRNFQPSMMTALPKVKA